MAKPAAPASRKAPVAAKPGATSAKAPHGSVAFEMEAEGGERRTQSSTAQDDAENAALPAKFQALAPKFRLAGNVRTGSSII
jgi:hypothetical protein